MAGRRKSATRKSPAKRALPRKSEEDRAALRDLREQDLMEQIDKIPEYIAEMKELAKENEELKKQMAHLEKILAGQHDKMFAMEKRNIEQARAFERLRREITASMQDPLEKDSGLSCEGFDCPKCGKPVAYMITKKNHRRIIVDRIFHTGRIFKGDDFQAGIKRGFDLKGEFISISSTAVHGTPARIWEYHVCK